jgi:GxxExxY protein
MITNAHDNSNLKQLIADSLDNKLPATSPSSGFLHADLSRAVIGACIEVHRHVGPGKLEAVYQRALQRELYLREIPFTAQAPVAMTYKGEVIGDFVTDFIIDRKLVVELKSVHRFEAVHVSQVLSYLRATNLQLGLLINFNVPILVQGVKRLIL